MLNKDLNLEARRAQFCGAVPYPSICIDDFLDAGFARSVAASYPSFSDALRLGRSYTALNERGKVQITDPQHFPDAVRALTQTLSAPAFLAALSDMTGIPNLIWDDHFEGGGMHQTNRSGWLDVHADFNLLLDRQLHRRLNLLIYLNEEWEEEWGGAVELWDANVKTCHQAYFPLLNRCIIFATNDVSFHGVTPVACPSDKVRKSFAVYYYTREAPPEYRGKFRDTVFRARPNEHTKRWKMPAVQLKRMIGETYQNSAYRFRQFFNK